MRLLPVDSASPIGISDADASLEESPSKKTLERKLRKRIVRLAELQARLYADGRYALLIVLQGRDASGKDGVIRTVFGACNPQGCEVTSFKEPTPLEQRHDFLWRVHAQVPPRGMVGIFNRSHYEDVIAARVHGLVPRDVWKERFDQINDFERMLAHSNVVILKFFLHVSRDEQRKRLLERIETPRKNWKFRMGDLADREKWNEYTDAYRDVLRRCSTDFAPWYVVPSDDNRVRDFLVADVVVRTLKRLKLQYPDADAAALLAGEEALQ